jgi:16S rRNA processing protein RimM
VFERFVPLGKIVTTHGIGGWLKLNSYNPESTVFSSAREICLEKEGTRSVHELESSKPHKRHFLIKLRGIDSINEAEKWVGSTLSLKEEFLPSLESGEYYQYQAIGLEVFDTRGDRLGVITGILSTASGELYVIQGASKEHLVPAVKEIVEKVDLSAGKMIINSPEGLLDL